MYLMTALATLDSTFAATTSTGNKRKKKREYDTRIAAKTTIITN